MVLLRKTLYIVFALLLAMPVFAKKAETVPTAEQEQQFLYYFYAARQAIMSKQFPKALVLLDYCAQLNPRDGKTKDNLGIIYDALGDSVKAGQLFAEAFEYAPDDCWRNYADFLMSTGEWRKGEQVLEAVSKRNPKDVEVAEYMLEVYMHNGKWKKALAQQDRLDALTGYDGQSALNRYRIYLEWKKAKKAVAEIDRYLEQDPESIYFLILRAKIYLSSSDYAGVHSTCVRIAQLAPYDEQEITLLRSESTVMYTVCVALTELADELMKEPTPERIAKGFGYYEQALMFMPQSPYILNNYAYNIALYGDDLKKAEKMSELTVKANPNNASYLDTYGWILHLQGQDALALFYLRKARENATDEAEIAVIEEHIAAIEQASQPSWRTAQVMMVTEVTVGGQTMKVNAQVNALRDSLITVSLMPIVGIEMFRIELTKTEATVIDKVNKRFTTVQMSEAESVLTPALKWTDLQQWFAAEGKNTGETTTMEYAFRGIELALKATYTNIVYDGAVNARPLRLDKYEQVSIYSLLGL